MADVDTSGNGAQLDCSVDSGICVEVTAKDLEKKLQEFKRILYILERDKEARRLLRERLSRIAERKIIKKKKNEQFCNVCFTPIDTEDSKTCIACCSCAKYVCRGGEKCSELVPKDGEWRCRLCTTKTDSYGKTSTWVEEQYSVKRATPAYAYPMRARSEIYIPLCDPNDSAFLCNFESVSEAPSTINVNQKQQIREYIEEVLAEMLGGSLDSTSVGPMSRSENYIPIGNEHELQGISHVRLRRLIESIIAETVRLPAFLQQSDTTPRGEQHSEPLTCNGNHCNGDPQQYFEPKRYQDLLATAVLNKIVDSHGNERHSESSPDLTSSAFDKNHNALFPNKTTDDSISSSSSIEPRSESSLTDPLHNIHKCDQIVSPIGSYGNFYADVENENIEIDSESVLSDFIASHMVPLPHISADPASEEEDEEDEDFISVTSSSRDNWEDNWLFKKKRSGKITSSIGMLVPAPKENIRALIGDKTTDEVSDLSEVGSDTDDSSLEMVSATLEPLNDRLVNQHLIGGKNTKVVLDELVEQSSMISTSSLPENARSYTDTKNEFVISNDGLSEAESTKMSLSNCNLIVSNEAINSNVSRPFTNNGSAQTEMSAKEPEISEEESIVPPPSDFTDDEKMRSLMAKFHEEQNNKMDSGDENSSSLSPHSSISCALSAAIDRAQLGAYEGITDFSMEGEENLAEETDILFGESSSSRRPSVIEILAAIALGPMLAVSASDDRNMLTELEVSSLMELNELAMAELNAKNAEERNTRLGMIAEESSFDSGNGDEERSNAFREEPDLLTSPNMVMKAIRELVRSNSNKSSVVIEEFEYDDDLEVKTVTEIEPLHGKNEEANYTDVAEAHQCVPIINETVESKGTECEETAQGEINEDPPTNQELRYTTQVTVDIAHKEVLEIPTQESQPESLLDEEVNANVSLSLPPTKNNPIKAEGCAQCEGQNDNILKTSNAKLNADSTSCSAEFKELGTEEPVPPVQLTTTFDIQKVSKDDNDPAELNSAECTAITDGGPSSSISNESLHTIGDSSEYSDCQDSNSIDYITQNRVEQSIPIPNEISSSNLSHIKDTADDFLLRPPMEFCDETTHKLADANEVHEQNTHMTDSNEDDGKQATSLDIQTGEKADLGKIENEKHRDTEDTLISQQYESSKGATQLVHNAEPITTELEVHTETSFVETQTVAQCNAADVPTAEKFTESIVLEVTQVKELTAEESDPPAVETPPIAVPEAVEADDFSLEESKTDSLQVAPVKPKTVQSAVEPTATTASEIKAALEEPKSETPQPEVLPVEAVVALAATFVEQDVKPTEEKISEAENHSMDAPEIETPDNPNVDKALEKTSNTASTEKSDPEVQSGESIKAESPENSSLKTATHGTRDFQAEPNTKEAGEPEVLSVEPAKTVTPDAHADATPVKPVANPTPEALLVEQTAEPKVTELEIPSLELPKPKTTETGAAGSIMPKKGDSKDLSVEATKVEIKEVAVQPTVEPETETTLVEIATKPKAEEVIEREDSLVEVLKPEGTAVEETTADQASGSNVLELTLKTPEASVIKEIPVKTEPVKNVKPEGPTETDPTKLEEALCVEAHKAETLDVIPVESTEQPKVKIVPTENVAELTVNKTADLAVEVLTNQSPEASVEPAAEENIKEIPAENVSEPITTVALETEVALEEQPNAEKTEIPAFKAALVESAAQPAIEVNPIQPSADPNGIPLVAQAVALALTEEGQPKDPSVEGYNAETPEATAGEETVDETPVELSAEQNVAGFNEMEATEFKVYTEEAPNAEKSIQPESEPRPTEPTTDPIDEVKPIEEADENRIEPPSDQNAEVRPVAQAVEPTPTEAEQPDSLSVKGQKNKASEAPAVTKTPVEAEQPKLLSENGLKAEIPDDPALVPKVEKKPVGQSSEPNSSQEATNAVQPAADISAVRTPVAQPIVPPLTEEEQSTATHATAAEGTPVEPSPESNIEAISFEKASETNATEDSGFRVSEASASVTALAQAIAITEAEQTKPLSLEKLQAETPDSRMVAITEQAAQLKGTEALGLEVPDALAVEETSLEQTPDRSEVAIPIEQAEEPKSTKDSHLEVALREANSAYIPGITQVITIPDEPAAHLQTEAKPVETVPEPSAEITSLEQAIALTEAEQSKALSVKKLKAEASDCPGVDRAPVESSRDQTAEAIPVEQPAEPKGAEASMFEASIIEATNADQPKPRIPAVIEIPVLSEAYPETEDKHVEPAQEPCAEATYAVRATVVTEQEQPEALSGEKLKADETLKTLDASAVEETSGEPASYPIPVEQASEPTVTEASGPKVPLIEAINADKLDSSAVITKPDESAVHLESEAKPVEPLLEPSAEVTPLGQYKAVTEAEQQKGLSVEKLKAEVSVSLGVDEAPVEPSRDPSPDAISVKQAAEPKDTAALEFEISIKEATNADQLKPGISAVIEIPVESAAHLETIAIPAEPAQELCAKATHVVQATQVTKAEQPEALSVEKLKAKTPDGSAVEETMVEPEPDPSVEAIPTEQAVESKCTDASELEVALIEATNADKPGITAGIPLVESVAHPETEANPVKPAQEACGEVTSVVRSTVVTEAKQPELLSVEKLKAETIPVEHVADPPKGTEASGSDVPLLEATIAEKPEIYAGLETPVESAAHPETEAKPSEPEQEACAEVTAVGQATVETEAVQPETLSVEKLKAETTDTPAVEETPVEPAPELSVEPIPAKQAAEPKVTEATELEVPLIEATTANKADISGIIATPVELAAHPETEASPVKPVPELSVEVTPFVQAIVVTEADHHEVLSVEGLKAETPDPQSIEETHAEPAPDPMGESIPVENVADPPKGTEASGSDDELIEATIAEKPEIYAGLETPVESAAHPETEAKPSEPEQEACAEVMSVGQATVEIEAVQPEALSVEKLKAETTDTPAVEETSVEPAPELSVEPIPVTQAAEPKVTEATELEVPLIEATTANKADISGIIATPVELAAHPETEANPVKPVPEPSVEVTPFVQAIVVTEADHPEVLSVEGLKAETPDPQSIEATHAEPAPDPMVESIHVGHVADPSKGTDASGSDVPLIEATIAEKPEIYAGLETPVESAAHPETEAKPSEPAQEACAEVMSVGQATLETEGEQPEALSVGKLKAETTDTAIGEEIPVEPAPEPSVEPIPVKAAEPKVTEATELEVPLIEATNANKANISGIIATQVELAAHLETEASPVKPVPEPSAEVTPFLQAIVVTEVDHPEVLSVECLKAETPDPQSTEETHAEPAPDPMVESIPVEQVADPKGTETSGSAVPLTKPSEPAQEACAEVMSVGQATLETEGEQPEALSVEKLKAETTDTAVGVETPVEPAPEPSVEPIPVKAAEPKVTEATELEVPLIEATNANKANISGIIATQVELAAHLETEASPVKPVPEPSAEVTPFVQAIVVTEADHPEVFSVECLKAETPDPQSIEETHAEPAPDPMVESIPVEQVADPKGTETSGPAVPLTEAIIAEKPEIHTGIGTPVESAAHPKTEAKTSEPAQEACAEVTSVVQAKVETEAEQPEALSVEKLKAKTTDTPAVEETPVEPTPDPNVEPIHVKQAAEPTVTEATELEVHLIEATNANKADISEIISTPVELAAHPETEARPVKPVQAIVVTEADHPEVLSVEGLKAKTPDPQSIEETHAEPAPDPMVESIPVEHVADPKGTEASGSEVPLTEATIAEKPEIHAGIGTPVESAAHPKTESKPSEPAQEACAEVTSVIQAKVETEAEQPEALSIEKLKAKTTDTPAVEETPVEPTPDPNVEPKHIKQAAEPTVTEATELEVHLNEATNTNKADISEIIATPVELAAHPETAASPVKPVPEPSAEVTPFIQAIVVTEADHPEVLSVEGLKAETPAPESVEETHAEPAPYPMVESIPVEHVAGTIASGSEVPLTEATIAEKPEIHAGIGTPVESAAHPKTEAKPFELPQEACAEVTSVVQAKVENEAELREALSVEKLKAETTDTPAIIETPVEPAPDPGLEQMPAEPKVTEGSELEVPLIEATNDNKANISGIISIPVELAAHSETEASPVKPVPEPSVELTPFEQAIVVTEADHPEFLSVQGLKVETADAIAVEETPIEPAPDPSVDPIPFEKSAEPNGTEASMLEVPIIVANNSDKPLVKTALVNEAMNDLKAANAPAVEGTPVEPAAVTNADNVIAESAVETLSEAAPVERKSDAEDISNAAADVAIEPAEEAIVDLSLGTLKTEKEETYPEVEEEVIGPAAEPNKYAAPAATEVSKPKAFAVDSPKTDTSETHLLEVTPVEAAVEKEDEAKPIEHAADPKATKEADTEDLLAAVTKTESLKAALVDSEAKPESKPAAHSNADATPIAIGTTKSETFKTPEEATESKASEEAEAHDVLVEVAAAEDTSIQPGTLSNGSQYGQAAEPNRNGMATADAKAIDTSELKTFSEESQKTETSETLADKSIATYSAVPKAIEEEEADHSLKTEIPAAAAVESCVVQDSEPEVVTVEPPKAETLKVVEFQSNAELAAEQVSPTTSAEETTDFSAEGEVLPVESAAEHESTATSFEETTEGEVLPEEALTAEKPEATTVEVKSVETSAESEAEPSSIEQPTELTVVDAADAKDLPVEATNTEVKQVVGETPVEQTSAPTVTEAEQESETKDDVQTADANVGVLNTKTSEAKIIKAPTDPEAAETPVKQAANPEVEAMALKQSSPVKQSVEPTSTELAKESEGNSTAYSTDPKETKAPESEVLLEESAKHKTPEAPADETKTVFPAAKEEDETVYQAAEATAIKVSEGKDLSAEITKTQTLDAGVVDTKTDDPAGATTIEQSADPSLQDTIEPDVSVEASAPETPEACAIDVLSVVSTESAHDVDLNSTKASEGERILEEQQEAETHDALLVEAVIVEPKAEETTVEQPATLLVEALDGKTILTPTVDETAVITVTEVSLPMEAKTPTAVTTDPIPKDAAQLDPISIAHSVEFNAGRTNVDVVALASIVQAAAEPPANEALQPSHLSVDGKTSEVDTIETTPIKQLAEPQAMETSKPEKISDKVSKCETSITEATCVENVDIGKESTEPVELPKLETLVERDTVSIGIDDSQLEVKSVDGTETLEPTHDNEVAGKTSESVETPSTETPEAPEIESLLVNENAETTASEKANVESITGETNEPHTVCATRTEPITDPGCYVEVSETSVKIAVQVPNTEKSATPEAVESKVIGAAEPDGPLVKAPTAEPSADGLLTVQKSEGPNVIAKTDEQTISVSIFSEDISVKPVPNEQTADSSVIVVTSKVEPSPAEKSTTEPVKPKEEHVEAYVVNAESTGTSNEPAPCGSSKQETMLVGMTEAQPDTIDALIFKDFPSEHSSKKSIKTLPESANTADSSSLEYVSNVLADEPQDSTEIPNANTTRNTSFNITEDKATGVKIQTVHDFTSQVSEAITETLRESQTIPSVRSLSETCKIIAHPSLQSTESLTDTAQNPTDVYDEISHPNLKNSCEKYVPSLADELRMAAAKTETKGAERLSEVSDISTVDQTPLAPTVNDSAAADQPNAQTTPQGNHISKISSISTQNSFAAKSQSSTTSLTTTSTRTRKTQYSGSQFRKLTLQDRRFLAELEKRRKQRELIQNYLDTLETIETPSYLTEDLYLESKSSIESCSPYSLFSQPPPDYCIVGATSTSRSAKTYFLNNILFSDRISYESNRTDDSTPTVIDTFDSSLKGSETDTDSGEDFSRDEATNRDSTTDTATTSTTKTLTTNNVTNQSHINSPPPPQSEIRTESACSALHVLETLTTGGNEEHVDDDLMKHLVPGSIAEREYKKWYNAVDMPNNPYSVEALKRRLSGGPEKFFDLPNISPSIEEKPMALGVDETKVVDDKNQERDYARYSRDYYINDAKHASGATKKHSSPATTPTASIESSLPPSTLSSSTEVIRSGFENRNKRDWTLSTPVRRSSSLKYPKQFQSSSTHKIHNDDDDDTSSHRSSRSLRTTQSAKRMSPSPRVLTQFEKQLLHKDLKRNSFRAISSTTKDFVLNPIFDQGEFFTDTKLSVRKDNLSDGNDDTADSGVDSCLNGVPGDCRRTSLLF